LGIEVKEEPAKPGDYGLCEVSAAISTLRNGRMTIATPKNEYTRKARLAFNLASEVQVTVKSDDYRRAKAGDEVTGAVVASFSTGDLVVKQIAIKLNAGVSRGAQAALSKEAAKYQDLSDEPGQPRDVRSAHFLV